MHSAQSFKTLRNESAFPLVTNTFREEDLQKWNVFRQISPSFLRKVRLSYVYEPCPDMQTGLLVTTDDQVFTIGTNCVGSGGFGCETDGPIKEPSRVAELCGKSVETFVSGGYHAHREAKQPFCLALTASGQVYSWGKNNWGQLGLGHFSDSYVPLLIGGGLEGKVVKQVSTAFGHSFAVTKEGEVYGWGYNEDHGRLGLGNEDLLNRNSPVRITLLPSGISSIVCAAIRNVALTQEGDVYVWGSSISKYLGIDYVEHTNIPTKITSLSNIKKIVCGYNHTIALDRRGELYGWGCNDFGQLGPIGDSSDSTFFPIPTKLPTRHVGVVRDIFAKYPSTLSTCQTSRSKAVWGIKRGNEIIKHERDVSLHDIFLLHSKSKFMLEPLVAKERRLSIGEWMENSFTAQDEFTTDVTFIIRGEKIHAHKSVLLRNEYFQTMFSKKWKESQERITELGSEVDYKTFYTILYYIYSDVMHIHEADKHEHLLDLAIQADFFLEKTLKEKCFDILRRKMNCENALDFYILAKEKNSEELKGHVFDVLAENLQYFVSVGAFADLNLTVEEHCQLLKSIAEL